MRIIVVGGSGNFGARICRALTMDRSLTVIAAGRHAVKPTQKDSPAGMLYAALDFAAANFKASLSALKPDIVIHCAGPFQAQDYRVALAALACGAHYIDLSDGREFVAGFAEAIDEVARSAIKSIVDVAGEILPEHIVNRGALTHPRVKRWAAQ